MQSLNGKRLHTLVASPHGANLVSGRIGWFKSGRIQYVGFNLGRWPGSSQAPSGLPKLGKPTRNRLEPIGLGHWAPEWARVGCPIWVKMGFKVGCPIWAQISFKVGCPIWAQVGFKVGCPIWAQCGLGQGKLSWSFWSLTLDGHTISYSEISTNTELLFPMYNQTKIGYWVVK